MVAGYEDWAGMVTQQRSREKRWGRSVGRRRRSGVSTSFIYIAIEINPIT